MNKIFFKILLPFLALVFGSSCEVDHGLGVMESSISGNVVFVNHDKKPDYVESVRIVAAVKYPFTSLSDVVFANTSVNLSKEQSEYELPAPLTNYQIVAAVWKEKGKTWDYTNLLGFYGFNPSNGEFEYKEISLTKQDPVAENVDIYCDWSFLSP
jgi:hypothetical protein